MKTTEIVVMVLRLEEGVAKQSGNAWKSRQIVTQTEGQHPIQHCFEFRNTNTDQLTNLIAGEQVTLEYSTESAPFRGRYYTRMTGWNLVRTNPNITGKLATEAGEEWLQSQEQQQSSQATPAAPQQ